MIGFNATQTDGSTPPIPLSSGISPGDKTPRPIMGGPEMTDSQGNTLTPVQTYPSQGSSAPLTSVSGSITSVSLLAANVNRKTFFVYNESAATLYLAWRSERHMVKRCGCCQNYGGIVNAALSSTQGELYQSRGLLQDRWLF